MGRRAEVGGWDVYAATIRSPFAAVPASARVSGASKARDVTRRARAAGKLTHIPAAHSTRCGRLFESTQILTRSVSVTDWLATAHIAYLLRHEVQGPIFRLNEDAIQIFE